MSLTCPLILRARFIRIRRGPSTKGVAILQKRKTSRLLRHENCDLTCGVDERRQRSSSSCQRTATSLGGIPLCLGTNESEYSNTKMASLVEHDEKSRMMHRQGCRGSDWYGEADYDHRSRSGGIRTRWRRPNLRSLFGLLAQLFGGSHRRSHGATGAARRGARWQRPALLR